MRDGHLMILVTLFSEKGINLEEDSLKTQYKQLQANPAAFGAILCWL